MKFLKTSGRKILTESDEEIRLRGVCVGGYLHLENYMHGFPGAECSFRASLENVLGIEKADFFWQRWMDYFFTEADVVYIRSLGANVIRLALNYRQFERDDNPFHYLEAGFERLNRVLDWCEKHKLYVILDMHAAQGWQNTDWHSDNPHRQTFLWHDRLYQDRFIALWREFATRLKDRSVVAGYDLMNEPVSNARFGRFNNTYTPDWTAFNHLIQRAVKAIREIDPKHIIFIEGDLYGLRFEGLEPPLEKNLVYSSHHYHPSTRGKTIYPGRQTNGEFWDADFQYNMVANHEGTRWTNEHQVPLWMGEFGGQYIKEAGSVEGQMQALDDQISSFEKLGIHWTYWNYKDIGTAAWVHPNPDSSYTKFFEPVSRTKFDLAMDPSTSYLVDPAIGMEFTTLAHHLVDRLNDPAIDRNANVMYMGQVTLTLYLATLYQATVARMFSGMSEQQLDELAKSFLFENCLPESQLVEVVQKHLQI